MSIRNEQSLLINRRFDKKRGDGCKCSKYRNVDGMRRLLCIQPGQLFRGPGRNKRSRSSIHGAKADEYSTSTEYSAKTLLPYLERLPLLQASISGALSSNRKRRIYVPRMYRAGQGRVQYGTRSISTTNIVCWLNDFPTYQTLTHIFSLLTWHCMPNH